MNWTISQEFQSANVANISVSLLMSIWNETTFKIWINYHLIYFGRFCALIETRALKRWSSKKNVFCLKLVDLYVSIWYLVIMLVNKPFYQFHELNKDMAKFVSKSISRQMPRMLFENILAMANVSMCELCTHFVLVHQISAPFLKISPVW